MPYARQARVMIELLLRMVDNVDYVEVRVCQCKRQRQSLLQQLALQLLETENKPKQI